MSDLRGANLNGACLKDAIFHNSLLQHARFFKANLKNADLFAAQMNHATLIEAKVMGARLYNAKLNYSVLIGAQLQGVELTGAELRCAHLAHADLTGSRLSSPGYLEPTRAVFDDAYLSRTLLVGTEGQPQTNDTTEFDEVVWMTNNLPRLEGCRRGVIECYLEAKALSPELRLAWNGADSLKDRLLSYQLSDQKRPEWIPERQGARHNNRRQCPL